MILPILGDLKPSEVISSIGSALDFVHSKGTLGTVCEEPAVERKQPGDCHRL